MKLLVALGLNCVLLWLLFGWVQAHYRSAPLGRWLLPLLGLKLLACAVACYLLTDDAAYYQHWGRQLTAQLWDEPGKWLQTLGGNYFWHGQQSLTFHGYSNTFFLIKLLSVFNLASLGSVVLNGVYLSLFCFVGSWQLAVAVAKVFPETPPGAPVVAFLLWPTVAYWTAGLTKEAVLLGSSSWLVALVLRWLYGAGRGRVGAVVGAVLLALLHFKMRFFFAAPLLAALAGLAVVRLLQHLLGRALPRVAQAALFAVCLAGGGWVSSEVSPVFRVNKFTNQLIRVHSDLQQNSENQPHIMFDHLAPTVESILHNTPKATFSALVRPLPWEAPGRPRYLVAGLENVVLIVLLLSALVAVGRAKAGELPFAVVLALLFYCLVLAALLGLSTPNLGTLNRYRAVMLPYLVLLTLQHPYAARWLTKLGL
ncbi:hypothetical protein [Hymenobacter metallicola]|uniref:Glycosyltransferase RgtA/B/C/D-like domain-containing protein n=1 Tax=Hymenobacter metallicola TaxID=2563114 RepID=A0A4Z0QJJ4_9BACT|nr:hypothetical protein [Hymenobacter metallicola]TGE28852.1 hypothetical protein E5K02_05155 [Hymenobacter metallicola]